MYLSRGILNMLENCLSENDNKKKRYWNDLQYRHRVGGHLRVRVFPFV